LLEAIAQLRDYQSRNCVADVHQDPQLFLKRSFLEGAAVMRTFVYLPPMSICLKGKCLRPFSPDKFQLWQLRELPGIEGLRCGLLSIQDPSGLVCMFSPWGLLFG
jgi:hypothetical protein